MAKESIFLSKLTTYCRNKVAVNFPYAKIANQRSDIIEGL